uniref:Secreted protein n=1 Tax=Rhipicephalus appendiculatus TaxID=34631 RepID=A0A131YDK7_RHIAP
MCLMSLCAFLLLECFIVKVTVEPRRRCRSTQIAPGKHLLLVDRNAGRIRHKMCVTALGVLALLLLRACSNKMCICWRYASKRLNVHCLATCSALKRNF